MRGLSEDPKTIKIDIAHTYAIAGFGKEDLASSIIFLAVRCAVWGDMAFEDQLEMAWKDFKGWCTANKKYTTILEFSKRELKITSWLVCHIWQGFIILSRLTLHGVNCLADITHTSVG